VGGVLREEVLEKKKEQRGEEERGRLELECKGVDVDGRRARVQRVDDNNGVDDQRSKW
jgi:hypothetical protein